MIRLLADENVDGRLIRGLLQQSPGLDLVRAQDVGLAGVGDQLVLEWAAREGRVVLTHDVKTMIGFAYNRAARGEPMPGVVVLDQSVPIGRAIREVRLFVEGSVEGEWEGQVQYLPF